MNAATEKPAAAKFATKKVGKSAFLLTSGKVEFGDNGPDTKSAPVRILARTGSAINHWYWGPCVHDFSGMKTKPRIALDYCHDDNQILGYANKNDVDADGLWLSGAITPFQPDDQASKVLFLAKQGVPFESSIDFSGDGTVIEEVPAGAQSMVNGQTVDGPMTIFRQWCLRGQAICPHGADANTRSEFQKFQAGEGEIEVNVIVNAGGSEDSSKVKDGGTPVATQTPPAEPEKNTPAAEPPKAGVEAASEKPGEVPAPVAAPVDPAAGAEAAKEAAGEKAAADLAAVEAQKCAQAKAKEQAAAEVKRFIGKFGPQGATWYAEGKSFEECKDLLILELQGKVTALETRLKQIPTGMKEGEVTLSPVEVKGGKAALTLAQKIGPAAAAFAESLVMPGSQEKD